MRDSRPQGPSLCAFPLVSALLALSACSGSGPRWSETESGIIRTVTNRGGQTLGYVTTSGVRLLTVDRFGFKDLNRNGALDRYEDWRLSADARARDLASRMSVEQIAGLMLYSAHQAIPGAAEPSGLLPFQMPASMQTVERQSEDTPRDMQPLRRHPGACLRLRVWAQLVRRHPGLAHGDLREGQDDGRR